MLSADPLCMFVGARQYVGPGILALIASNITIRENGKGTEKDRSNAAREGVRGPIEK
jgi:hypothetical protein